MKSRKDGGYEFEWKRGNTNEPHIFWDSDIAKWIEAATYILAAKPDKKLENEVDRLVDLIEKHQALSVKGGSVGRIA